MAGGAPPADAPAVAPTADPEGGAWVGLASRATLGMTSSFKDGWRQRGTPPAAPPAPARPRPAPAAPPARPRPTPRAAPAAPPAPAPPPAPPVEVRQGDGESNADAASALRRRLGL
jgi:hypothetical protein